jgi:hypothetical protein
VETQLVRSRIVKFCGYDVPCINTTFAVSELVGELEAYGGGGHANAAGFTSDVLLLGEP